MSLDMNDLLEVHGFCILGKNQVPWEQVNADFVVEYSVKVDDKAQISDKNESWNSCLRCLPKVIISFGLHVDEAISRLHFSTDNGESAKRAATFSIVTRSTVAAKAVCKVFEEWDEQPTSLLFHANAVFDRYVDVDDSSVDLKVTLEKAGCYSSTNRIATR
ncbi:glyceraldehyde-3-phosphate dehydrogenase 1, cytosolic [Setaria viridis]|uniref:glyceraldehyde-3-phosphate dehydrogenase 1, cytosolic n=1 Tax=Setaria viridis TaxID=4556 RepID=UPI003B3AB416